MTEAGGAAPSLARRPGLVWGFDFTAEAAIAVTEEALFTERPRACGFRWLHFDLADQRTQRWFEAEAPVPVGVRALFGSPDDQQRHLFEEGVLALVLHDLEYEFYSSDNAVGGLRVALGPDLMITARRHPVRSAELARQRLQRGQHPHDAPAALDILFGALAEAQRVMVSRLDDEVQRMEDDLLRDRPPPGAHAFLSLRSLMVRLHRMFAGMRAVMVRLEDEPGLPPAMAAAVERFGQRIAAVDTELSSIQGQLRLLREELDLQAVQRTNQNLYILSILSVLLLPATLITGLFGMNTGGFPWASDRHGTLFATLLAFAASAAVYLALRLFGFLRR